ncbi:beta-propeller fold lactonase family protein [Leptospira sp. WS39.C2]
MLNPIVQQLLFLEKDNKSQNYSLLWALLGNQNFSVELNRSWAGIRRGGSVQLQGQLFAYGQATDSTFLWSSSDPTVASVDASGLVQGIGNGKVSITATTSDGRASSQSLITVYSGYVYTTLNIPFSEVGHLTMNETDGLLSANPKITLPGTDPNGIVTDPAGRFLYTGDFTSGTISQFLINPISGALTANSVPTIAAGANARNLVVTPDGRYLYLASEGTQAIRAYSINGDGTLSFISSTPTNIGHSQVQISRDGNFVFYLRNTVTELVSYRINQTDGTLSLAGISPSFTNDGSGHVSTHPNGNFLYLGSYPSISVFNFDRITGNMGLVESVLHSKTINGSAIHPNGLFYYTVDMNDFSISLYQVNPITGRLTFVNTITGFSASSIRFIIIEPGGRYAYVADNGGDLKQFSINQTTGELTYLGGLSPGGFQWNLLFL